MAARYDCSDSAPSSLPPPFPKSPPEYPDLYGKRREIAKIQLLEREIGYLEAELKSVNGLRPTSRSCKEIVDFVAANSDPIIPTFKKNLRRYHRFRKWLCGLLGFGLSRVHCCCYSGCAFQTRTPRSCRCCCCNFDCNWTPSCPADCLSCALPECLQWQLTGTSCLSCASLPESLQRQPNLCCCSCPDQHSCKNTSFGRRGCSFSNHTSCCLPSSCGRSCSKWSCCFNLCNLCS